MKKNNLRFAFYLFLFFIIYGCNNLPDNNPVKVIEKKNFPPEQIPPAIPYDSIGIIHNQTCDYVYRILVSKKLEGSLNCNDSILFYSYNSGLTFLIDSLNLDWVNIVPVQYYSMWDYITTEDFNDSVLWTPDIEDSLTIMQKNILNQLNSIIDNGVGLTEIISNINNLEIYAQSECNEDEIVIILSALSVAKHSLTYWHDNLNNWLQIPYIQKVISESNGKRIQDINWKDVAKADVVGAIAGGVGGAAVGAIWGAVTGAAAGGIGAIPGALAGALSGAASGALYGAIGASVGVAAKQLLGW